MPVLSPSRSADLDDLRPSWTARLPLWTLVASLAAAAGIHLAVGYGHDFAGRHGAFFAVAGVVQAIGAVAVARRGTRGLVAVAATGSVALLVIWFVERSPGFAGGDAFEPLAVATAVAELVTVVVAVRMLARPIAAPGRLVGIVALGLVGLVAVGAGGLADDGHDHDHHHHAPDPDAPVVADGTPHEPAVAPGPAEPEQQESQQPLPVPPPDDHAHDDDTPHDH